MDSNFFATCLYCDDPTGSREHPLSSGIGGQFVTTALLCAFHNKRCGEFADDPLCKQFEWAVHCLEVLKGGENKTRGTKWQGLKSHTGAMFETGTDFRTRMTKAIVTQRDENDVPMRIEGTGAHTFAGIEKHLEATADLQVSWTETQRHEFAPAIEFGKDEERGVLKAAWHFVACFAADPAEVRRAAPEVASAIFSKQIPDIVGIVPYRYGSWDRPPRFHGLTAWNEDGSTFVRVNLFNVVTYMVRLPHVTIVPTCYRQNILSGERRIERCDVPYIQSASVEDFRREFARRVDIITDLGWAKTEVVDILDAAKEHNDAFSILGPELQRRYLEESLRQNFHGPRWAITMPWFAAEVLDFTRRQIEIETAVA